MSADPALDPPLTIRVHPDDNPRDPQARRAVKTSDLEWMYVSGPGTFPGYIACEDLAGWPCQHWLVVATVFRHAEHVNPRAGKPAAGPVALSPDESARLFRMTT